MKKLIPVLEGENDSCLAFERKGKKIILHGCKIIKGKVESVHSFDIKVKEE